MVSAQEIRVVAELLQISPEGLQKAITYKVTVSIKLCFTFMHMYILHGYIKTVSMLVIPGLGGFLLSVSLSEFTVRLGLTVDRQVTWQDTCVTPSYLHKHTHAYSM